jgi:hypothetical protein
MTYDYAVQAGANPNAPLPWLQSQAQLLQLEDGACMSVCVVGGEGHTGCCRHCCARQLSSDSAAACSNAKRYGTCLLLACVDFSLCVPDCMKCVGGQDSRIFF